MHNTVRELSTKENSLTDHDCKDMPVMKLSVYPYLAAKSRSRWQDRGPLIKSWKVGFFSSLVRGVEFVVENIWLTST